MPYFHLFIKGHVQGVGFRPFIYRLAHALTLKGCVFNDHRGVTIYCQCDSPTLLDFVEKIHAEKPPVSSIEELTTSEISYDALRTVESVSALLSESGFLDFTIIESASGAHVPTAAVLPDLKVCAECLQELQTESDRRYRYPFINCTQCGPRFSIIQSLPYDRSRTTMSPFKMCEACAAEYNDPSSRRFHAEPIACPHCGPQLSFCTNAGEVLSLDSDDALQRAVKSLHEGKIIALKGIGGFQLLAKASDMKAVSLLRQRKKRSKKPFAIMVQDRPMAEAYVELTLSKTLSKNVSADSTWRILESTAAPIVLLKDKKRLAANINPGNPYLGVMVATSPLHFLLLKELKEPMVATSGNLSEEPLCIDNQEALQRLGGSSDGMAGGIADFFLLHDRDIERPVDDSVVQIAADDVMILRRARGYAPKTFKIENFKSSENQILALGGHLKSTFCFFNGERLSLSQHIGDLDTSQTQEFWLKEIKAFEQFYQTSPQVVLHDLHPGYASTRLAQEVFAQIPRHGIQHHEAHAWAGIFECHLENKDLGVAIWDGAGFGHDGTIWGGEFFLHRASDSKLIRTGTLEPLQILGGERAYREPWRLVLSLLFRDHSDLKDIQTMANQLGMPLKLGEFEVLQQIWSGKLNTPLCSSMGRMFDVFSYLLDTGKINQFEGDAAMSLQFSAEKALEEPTPLNDMEFSLTPNWQQNVGTGLWELSFKQALAKVLAYRARHEYRPPPATEQSLLALKFHEGLVASLLEWTKIHHLRCLLVGGGVFQNRLLLQLLSDACRAQKVELYFSREIPPNDGGISLGQIAAFTRRPHREQ